MEVKFPLVISDKYENCNKLLGSGGFANVILAEHRVTSEKVAVKLLNKSSLKDDLKRATTEIEIHRTLHHQNICQLYDVYEDTEYIILILEYASGGELFDYIVSKKYLPEDEARVIFRQILSALSYLHSCGYAHRDLKPENILIDESSNLKIIDFGLCAKPIGGLDQLLATCCGSPAYAAPELLSGKPYYGNEIDVWSLGILLYAILCGYLPFDDDDISELYRLILSGKYLTPKWITKEAKLLLSKMIRINPKQRATVEELLKDKWVNQGYSNHQTIKNSMRVIIDKSIAELIGRYYNKDLNEVVDLLRLNTLSEITAHYYLVCKRCSRFKSMFPNVAASLSLGEVWCKSTKDNFIAKISEMKFKDNELPKPVNIISNMNYDNVPMINTPYKIVDAYQTYKSPLNNSKHVNNSMDDLIAIKNYCFTPKKTSNDKENIPLPCTPKNKNNIFDKMIDFFTPKHTGSSNIPRKVKALCNVATTSQKSANEVQQELQSTLNKLLQTKEISSVENEKFIFKCRVNNPRLIFELEICILNQLTNSIAIQRKRNKGDSWQYKKICERIFSLTNL